MFFNNKKKLKRKTLSLSLLWGLHLTWQKIFLSSFLLIFTSTSISTSSLFSLLHLSPLPPLFSPPPPSLSHPCAWILPMRLLFSSSFVPYSPLLPFLFLLLQPPLSPRAHACAHEGRGPKKFSFFLLSPLSFSLWVRNFLPLSLPALSLPSFIVNARVRIRERGWKKFSLLFLSLFSSSPSLFSLAQGKRTPSCVNICPSLSFAFLDE